MTDIQYTTLLNEISKLNDLYSDLNSNFCKILITLKALFENKTEPTITKALLESCPLDSDLDKFEIEETKKAKEELSNILSSKVIDENALSKFNCTVPEL